MPFDNKIISGICSVYTPVLFCICLLTFGSYFTYDTPGALGMGAVCEVEGNTFSHIKCYRDSAMHNHTGFELHYMNISSDEESQMSTQDCMSLCWFDDAEKWTTFATQHGHKCYCATNRLEESAMVSYQYCNEACNASDSHAKESDRDRSFYCGGMTPDGIRTASSWSFSCKVQTIQMWFKKKGKEYTNFMNLSLYSVYNYPNMLLALLGGMLVDRIGLRLSTIIFLAAIFGGELLFVLGIQWRAYWAMVLGRLMFALGGESLTVSQSVYCARWFKSTGYMALAFGMSLSFSRIGSAVGFLSMPLLAQEATFDWALWIGVIACMVSLVVALFAALLDRYGESKGLVEKPTADDPFKISDLKAFGLEMWLITGICLFYYIAVLPFNDFAKNFFNEKWHASMVEAGVYVSVYTFVSAGGSPIIGFLIDRAGVPLVFIFIGCCSVIGCHLVMWLTTLHPVVCMVWMGLSITFLGASLWPSVPYVVPRKVTGSAYGLMTSIQNLGLGLIPQLIAKTLDSTKNQGVKQYYYCLWILMACSAVAIACTIGLFMVNAARGGVLMMTVKAREEKRRQLEDEETPFKSDVNNSINQPRRAAGTFD